MQLSRLFLLSTSYILGLLIFQRGFLLKRQVLSNKSNCDDVLTDKHCWNQPLYNKTIWLIIDALRYDFIYPIDSINITYKERYYKGHMPKVGNILKKYKNQSKLYKFKADPPTTTLQRLKALTTGSLPTFIEAGDNFGGTEILEDNLINQLKNSGKNITFLGDDTWISILPNKFTREFPAPSFDIKDLHTVDNLVESKIYNEIKRNDWNIVIAHCLGVDHCGHRYGPDHPEMSKKLKQMDNLIYNLIEEMDNDTLLIINGDHGMTDTGDHGGDSEQEITAAMFIYSKKGLPNNNNKNIDDIEVNQIDLIPTLSFLMDIPIPFSNLGMIIKNLIPESLISEAMKLNCMQIVRYAQACLQNEPSLSLHLEWILKEYEASTENDPTDAERTIEKIQQVLRNIWTSFDLPLIFIGILVIFEALIFNIFHLFKKINNLNDKNNEDITSAIWIYRTGMILLKLALFIGKSDDLIITLLTGSLILSICYYLIIMFMQMIAHKLNYFTVIPIIIGIIYSLTFLSNSFIVYEPSVIRFMLQSLFIYYLFNHFKKIFSMKKQLFWKTITSNSQILIVIQYTLIMIGIRLGNVFEKCREEQLECIQTIFPLTMSSITMDWTKTTRLFFGIVSLLTLNKLMINRQQNRYQLNEYSRIIKAISWPICLLISLHWLCEFVSSNYDQFGLKLAQIVYVIFVLSIIVGNLLLNYEELIQSSLHLFVLIMSMILGDGLTPNLLILILINDFGFKIIGNDPLYGGLFLTLTISHGFFSLGHTSTLSQIPWHAAFVGIPGNFTIQAIPGLLVILHIFASIFILIWRNNSSKSLTNAQVLSLILFTGFKALSVCLAGYIHRRHLMLFKIFAPKFIFEGIGFIFMCLFLISLQLFKCLRK